MKPTLDLDLHKLRSSFLRNEVRQIELLGEFPIKSEDFLIRNLTVALSFE